MGYFESLNRLIMELSKLPGIGEKSAARHAYYLLQQPVQEVQKLADAMMIVSGLAACDKPGPAESAGKKIDQASESVTASVSNTPGRFIRLNYTVATGPFTAGTIFSYVNPIMDRQQYFDYPINYAA